MTKRFAFTLAEVLIALAIIGVVAAMTIPTFMANTAGAQFRTGFKKGISVMTQAVTTNFATEDYDFASADAMADNATDIDLDDASTRFGFNTDDLAPGDDVTDLDLVANAHSLYHIFKGNLNLKNSNEITNYAVNAVDPTMDCEGLGGTMYAATTMTISVPGLANSEATPSVAAKALADFTDRNTLFDYENITVPETVHGGMTNLCGGNPLAEGGINQGRMFMLEDGMVFTYDPKQGNCTESNPCFGYLDVNGEKGPNRVISCSPSANNQGNANAYIRSYGRVLPEAEAQLLLASCTVAAKDTTDIYPVLFYGSHVKPASLAAKSVLYSQKSNQVTD